jgi:stress response protein SCP2
MSVNLQNGESISLTNEISGLSKITVGLGWDEATITIDEGLFRKKKKVPIDIDCDASAILLRSSRLCSEEDIVYTRRLEHGSGAIHHLGDNLTGEGDGDDEQIVVDLANLPAEYDKIVFVVNIYRAHAKEQNFGMINNAFIRIVDNSTSREICRYNLTEDYAESTALVCGDISKVNNEWCFNADSKGTPDDDIEEVAERYK